MYQKFKQKSLYSSLGLFLMSLSYKKASSATLKTRILTSYIFMLITIVTWPVSSAFAQRVLDGDVRESGGGPLAGATILLKETNVYAVADAEGQFKIEAVKDLPFSLIVKFVGYKSNEVQISELSGPIKIVLTEDS